MRKSPKLTYLNTNACMFTDIFIDSKCIHANIDMDKWISSKYYLSKICIKIIGIIVLSYEVNRTPHLVRIYT